MKVDEFLKINRKNTNYLKGLIKRVLLTITTILIVLVLCNSNNKIKTLVKKYTLEENYNFSKINKIYNKYISKFKKTKEKVSLVNNEKLLNYKTSEKYKNGVLLEVDDSTNVKMLESGLVVFIGNKNDIENVIVVQQSNGIDVMYGYVENLNIKVYDYIEKGTILGIANKKLYLEFSKDGAVIDYEPYIK